MSAPELPSEAELRRVVGRWAGARFFRRGDLTQRMGIQAVEPRFAARRVGPELDEWHDY